MGIKHAFVNPKSDGGDATITRPSDWNAAHTQFGVYDVRDYGALGDLAQDDTTYIQAAIDACNAAGGGIVYFPRGNYLISTLTYYSNMTFQGEGGARLAGAVTQMYQYTGSDVLLKNANNTVNRYNFTIRDMLWTGNGNQTNNAGGILLENTKTALLENVQVSYCKNFGFKVLGGPAAGDSELNCFINCGTMNMLANAQCYMFQSSTNSFPNGARLINCFASEAIANTTTGIRVDKYGMAGAADEISLIACLIQGTTTFINSDGNGMRVSACRFEVPSGNANMVFNPLGPSIPGLVSQGSHIAVPGTFTFTDNGTVKAVRMGDMETGGINRFQLGNDATPPAAVAGALEYDGKALYFCPATSQRGLVQAHSFAAIASDFTLAAAAGVQAAFPAANDVLTLSATTAYLMEGLYIMNTGATTHTTALAFALGGGATVTSFEYLVDSWSAAANTIGVSQVVHVSGVASKVINATSTAVWTLIRFRGLVRMNAAGTITPQINFSANPTGTNLMKVGSYITFTPMGLNTVASVGNWA
jgi:hypothetical protein